MRAAVSMPAEKSTPIAVAAARREVAAEVAGAAREVEHPRPGGQRERVDRPAAPAPVEPERDHAVHAVVPRREAVEHPLDRVALGVALRQRAVAAEHRRVHARSQPGSLARSGELAGIADGLEVLLRDLEQHAAEVVRDQRGDRGQQGAERVDQPRGLLVVGERRACWIGRRTCASNISTASRGDRARRVVVAARQREEVGEREARFEQSEPGAQDVGVGLGVARRVRRAAAATIRPSRADRVEQRCRHADARGELVEREQLGVACLRARRPRRRAARRSASSSPASEPADHREREALGAGAP